MTFVSTICLAHNPPLLTIRVQPLKTIQFLLDATESGVTRLGYLLDFGQFFKAFGNN